ncbi:MAG: SDR family oxidoreductase [Flavobacteriaceae bacterium]|nr:SDR family oxidoreductase [Flavobacteriaceae bacterium]
MNLLQNKVAIITGAASGIGKDTAILFAKEGAKVVVSDINVEEGEKVVQEIKEMGGDAIFIKCDTSKAEEHEKMVQKTVEKFGALHIAVNNAGIGGASAEVGEYSIEEWNKVININLNGVFYGMRYQLPEMEKTKNASIINIASILGHVGFAQSAAYVASKHGVVGLTKTAAWDYAKKGVRVNAIGPGFVYTGLVNEETMGKETLNALEEKHAFGRLGESIEIAEMCLWLASDKASFVTGSYYPVDGGYLAV